MVAGLGEALEFLGMAIQPPEVPFLPHEGRVAFLFASFYYLQVLLLIVDSLSIRASLSILDQHRRNGEALEFLGMAIQPPEVPLTPHPDIYIYIYIYIYLYR